MNRTIALVVALNALGCGDLSNEDLLFDAALPDKTLEITPPQDSGTTSQALGDSWLLETDVALTAAGRINLFVDRVIEHISTISANAPDVRSTGHREWKAVRIASTGLWARLTMDAVGDMTCDVSFSPLPANAPQYRWTVEVSAERDTGFVGMITGESRGLEFSDSCGDVSMNAAAARTLGMVFDDSTVDPVISMDESWERTADEVLLTVNLKTDGTLNSYLDGHIAYVNQRLTSGSGQFQFTVRDNVRGNGIEHLYAILQWDLSGQPWRSDFCVDPTTTNACGTGCGPDPGDRTYLTDTTGLAMGSASACGGLTYMNPVPVTN